ncbi:hypothetical protein [Pseudanabaena sp. UWO310]|uniref:hypothetical protein n=1 Tax=Pseudanabaena sp. UWO310 TaxID=2480795 RepID=UPI00115B4D82|nr:hypothetical protein [Pseudanabaena sp. UWO310]TYQ30877.1 hypothetical protein PseudUWO310_06700 [Pseudanabaena sp. UWO310]
MILIRLTTNLEHHNVDMSSFHTHARIVRRSDLPFHYRRSAFRSCIQLYHWLIKQKFQTTYLRYSKHFGFDESTGNCNESLNRAMDALETERNLFLEKLRLFDKKRIREKIGGRRLPSKIAVDSLYKDMKFIVPLKEDESATEKNLP